MGEHNPTALSVGAVFHGRYQIARCLKAGGMGAIYECVHLTTRKHRALKVMLPDIVADPRMRGRFDLEARVTAEIESEHIVETFDAGVDEATGMPFLVMELLRGDDLDGMLRNRGPFHAEETVALLSQAALALDRTHAAGIVHRDLKPQNLFLIKRDDGAPRLKILDFGIAKVVADGSKTAQPTASIGTPVYMAPEQATGDGTIGPPADLYALGHIAYTLLVGTAYWMQEFEALPIVGFLNKMLGGQREPPSERAARRNIRLPVAFDAWFARATAISPRARFTSASAQIAELGTALGLASPQVSSSTVAPIGPPQVGAPVSSAIATTLVHVPSTARLVSPPLLPSPPLDNGASGGMGTPAAREGTVGVQLSDAVVSVPSRRSAGRLAAGALLLLLAGIGGTVAFTYVLGGSAPATSATQPSATADGQTDTTSMEPVLPTASTVASAAAPVAVTASATATASATTAVRPRTTKPPSECNPPYVVDASGRHRLKPQCY